MSAKEINYICDEMGLCCPSEPSSFYISDKKKKPLEIYMFIDPLCPECWALEPIIKKLQMEYSPYFTLRTYLGSEMRTFNKTYGPKKASQLRERARKYNETASRTGMPCDGDVWNENTLITPYTSLLAVKAAELQGKAIGSKYLRSLREALFLNKQNIADENVLIECAEKVEGMDISEFRNDLNSQSASKAFQCDVKTTKEMDVTTVPTLVFFNDDVNEPGLKVSGLYDYHIYVSIMEEMLGKKLEKCPTMSLESFLKFYTLVAAKEVSVVFDWTPEEVERQMKRLKLMQKVEKINVKNGTLWRYID